MENTWESISLDRNINNWQTSKIKIGTNEDYNNILIRVKNDERNMFERLDENEQNLNLAFIIILGQLFLQ